MVWHCWAQSMVWMWLSAVFHACASIADAEAGSAQASVASASSRVRMGRASPAGPEGEMGCANPYHPEPRR